MTNIFVWSKNQEILKLIVSGHSQIKGIEQDSIICAGISAIVFGSVNIIQKYFLNKITFMINSKQTKIEFSKTLILTDKKKLEIKFFFNFLLTQLETLAYNYPEWIKIIYKKI